MRALHWPLILFVGACSPYQYAKQVTDFSSGVTDLSSSVDGGYASLAADRAAFTHQVLVDSGARATTTVSCGAAAKKTDYTRIPCGVLQKGEPEPRPFTSQLDHAAIVGKLKILGSYVHALQAVTNAADRDAFNAAAKQLEGAISNLAAKANVAAPGAGAIAPAVTNGILWLVGVYLDNDRFDTLQKAVNIAAVPVRNLSKELGTGLQEVSSNRRPVLRQQADELLKPPKPMPGATISKERLSLAEAMLAKLDAVPLSDPAGAAQAMADTHDALVASVNDPHTQLANLMKTADDFESSAKAVKNALSTLEK